MASRRQLKKIDKKNLRKIAMQRLRELQELEIENQQIEAEIASLKKKIQSKKATLRELRQTLADLNNLGETNLLNTFNKTLTINDIKEAAKKARDSGDSYNNAEHWAAIKRYNELVNLGIIPMGSIMDKYDAAEYLRNVLSEDELNALVRAGERKEEVLWAKDAVRNSDVVTFDW